jgi:branched-chain amino acid transport system substrate-binding protein
VGGHNLELVAYDDGADPAMAVEQARKLATDTEIIAVIGHFREETTAAAMHVYAKAGIPLLAPGLIVPELTRGDTPLFRLGPAAGTIVGAVHRYLSSAEMNEVALVTEGGPLGVHLQQNVPSDGAQIRAMVSPNETDWLPKVRASGARGVLCDADPITSGEVVAGLREAGWDGHFLGGPELAATDFTAVAGDAARGAMYVTPWPFPADVQGSRDFVAAYRGVSGGLPPGPLALPAYEAAWVLIEATSQDLASRQSPSRRGVLGALPATEREGLLGTIVFDAARSWSDAPLYWCQVVAAGSDPVRECAPATNGLSPGASRSGAMRR